MSTGLENAASAFEKEIGGSTTPNSNDGGAQETVAVEAMFENMGKLEIDDESPATAGGDAEDDAKAAQKPQRRTKPVKADDDDEDPEAELYRDPDDPDAEKADEDEDDEDDDEDAPETEVLSEDELEALSDRKVIVTVDGEEQEVTLSEALGGYIRLETFHQRLNEVNEAQQLIDNEANQVQASRAKYADMLKEAQELMEAVLPPEPDWDALFAKDSTKARALQKSYGEMQGKIDEIKGKRKTALEEGNQQYIERMARYRDLEAKKFDASNPNWVGEEGKKRKLKDLQSMVRTGRALGFSDTELNQVVDSRMLGILLKASKYDRMMAARTSKKPMARGKKLTNSGVGKTAVARSTAPRGIDRAQKQLSRTGKVEDAAAVFQSIIR